MLTTIDLSKLTNRVGVSQLNLAESARGLAVNQLKASVFNQNLEEIQMDETSFTSYLGTPVYSNFIIPSGQYTNNAGEVVTYDGIRMDSVLFEVTPTKNIVRTAINGSEVGTVKQYISMGDYEIRGTAIITGQSLETSGGQTFNVNKTSTTPEQEIRKLNAIFKIPQEFEVESEFLDFLDISTIVMEGMRVAQVEGYRDTIAVDFFMLSDTPVELR